MSDIAAFLIIVLTAAGFVFLVTAKYRKKKSSDMKENRNKRYEIERILHRSWESTYIKPKGKSFSRRK